MANKTEGHAALKRSWTAQEILERLALCVDDDHCAGKCIEEPCVLQDTAFLCSVAREIETQRAEIRAQRQANEGHRVMVAKLPPWATAWANSSSWRIKDSSASRTAFFMAPALVPITVPYSFSSRSSAWPVNSFMFPLPFPPRCAILSA